MNKPKKIRLEVSSICQLKCPSCPTTTKAIHPTVGSGCLQLTDFQKLVKENPWVRAIELSNYGEIFLNSELSEIMREAFSRHISLTADNGVNLNHANENVLEDLVRYRFHSMTCSIDGATSETYQIYRVRGNFDAVISNIEKINQLKKKYRSPYPLLVWQFVVFGHNEHEIPLARELAHQFNMKFRPKLTWDSDFSPIRDGEYVKRQLGLGAATRQEFKELYGVNYRQDICHQLWDQPQINWDGKILGCCRNFWGDFGGNAFTDGLLRSLNNEKLQYAKEMLLGKQQARVDIPCTTCEIYLGMRANHRWLIRGWSWWLTRLKRGVRQLAHVGIFRYFFRVF